jgi:hypothetical protein
MPEQPSEPRWPRLRIDRSVTPPQRQPACEVVIRHPDGGPFAYGWVDEDGDHWLEVASTAVFRFRPGSSELVAIPHGSGVQASIVDAYQTSALPVAFQVSGCEALHASAVRMPAGVVAFCAYSGTGKSTVAYAMSRRGYALWADDAVVVDGSSGDPIVCHPIPFSLHLRAETRAFFEVGPVLDPVRLEDGPGEETAPLAAVVLLERAAAGSDCAGPAVERLSLAEALTGVLPHAHRFTLADPDRKRQTLLNYLDLAGRIPVFRARFRPGLPGLPDLLDRIEAAVHLGDATV